MKTKLSFSIFTFFASCILLSGCSQNRSGLKASDHNLTKISIEYQDPTPLNKFIENTKLVRLGETDPLIGNIDNLIVTKDKIVVTDAKNSTIFIFDTTGKNTAVINRQGRGPIEYLGLDYAALTPDGEKIALHDNLGKKVLIFDLDGNFIEKKNVDFWFSSFEYIDDNHILCITYGAQNDLGLVKNGDSKNLAYITDSDFKIENGFLPNIYTDKQYMHVTPHMKKFDSTLYVNPNFCDTLYRISGNTLEALYHVDMSKVDGVANFEADMTNEKIASALANKTTFPGIFTANDNFLLMKISTPESNRPMLWSKKSGKIYTLTDDPRINAQGECGIFDFHMTTCAFSHADRFIAAVPAYILNMGTYTEQVLKEYPEMVGLSDESNPMLIFYKLREPI